MSPDGLATLRHIRDTLLLIQNHLDHLYGDIAINEPVGECIVMVASLRQEITDAINVS